MTDRTESPFPTDVSDAHEQVTEVVDTPAERHAKKRQKSTPANKAEPAELAEELKLSISTIDKHLRAIETTTLQSAYAIGCEVKRVQDEARYGQRGVEFMASKLGVSYRKLATHAQVVRTWPDQAKFEELAATQRAGHRRLDWSHFVELAQANDADRDALLERALKEGLTVDELREAKAALAAKAPEAPSARRAGRRSSARHLAVVPSTETQPNTTSSAISGAGATSAPVLDTEPTSTLARARLADELVAISETLRAAASLLGNCEERELNAECLSALSRLKEAAQALESSLGSVTEVNAAP